MILSFSVVSPFVYRKN